MNAIRITVFDTARQDQTALHIAELQDGSITTFETRIYYWLIYPDGRSEPEVTQRDIRAAQGHRTVVRILQTIVRTPTRTGGVTLTVLTALQPYLNEGRVVKGVSTLRPAEMHEAARELELLSWPVSAQRNFRRTLALLSTPDTAACRPTKSSGRKLSATSPLGPVRDRRIRSIWGSTNRSRRRIGVMEPPML